MKIIVVTVEAARSDCALVSRLRDAAEDVHRKFMAEPVIDIPDMDSATTRLHIEVRAPRFLGDVSAFLKKAIRRHGLSEYAVITRGDRSSP
jgi:hypothetical protein